VASPLEFARRVHKAGHVLNLPETRRHKA
jgi:hypothetical protein